MPTTRTRLDIENTVEIVSPADRIITRVTGHTQTANSGARRLKKKLDDMEFEMTDEDMTF